LKKNLKTLVSVTRMLDPISSPKHALLAF